MSTGKIHIKIYRNCLITCLLTLGILISYKSTFAQNIANKNSTNNSFALKAGSGAYATGHYRDLFKELGYSQKQINAKVKAAFHQLFFGKKDQRVYFPAGKNANGPLAYVTDVFHHDVRTEGMSYGMMIAVQLNKKKVFDALWNWAMTYMYIKSPKEPAQGYFRWSMKTDGKPNSETPAPDGEEFFAMSLYFAAGRWGNGKGIYNYQHWANKILTAIRHHPLKTGKTKFGVRTVHNMINEKYKLIRFVPGVKRNNFSDPSYDLPAFYELWARWGPVRDRKFWAEAADSGRVFFVKATNPVTGLAPDYANFDGSPHVIKGFKYSYIFSADAWRTQRNWSVDWSWWHKYPEEQKLSNRLQSFFISQGFKTYGDKYTINGDELGNNHAVGLMATNAVASLAATKPQSKKFVKALWDAQIPHKFTTRYYDGLLYLMGLLHCSGKYRIWTPTEFRHH